jgi:putative phosphoribosyl transferase
MRVENRAAAGQALVPPLLAVLRDPAGPAPPAAPILVLALPRGGIPVARPIADAPGAALDVLVMRKLGAPGQPELTLGALVEGGPPRLASIGAFYRDVRQVEGAAARALVAPARP